MKYLNLQDKLTIYKQYPLLYRVFSNPLRERTLGSGLYSSIKQSMLNSAKFNKRFDEIFDTLLYTTLKHVNYKYQRYICISPTLLRFPILIMRLKSLCKENKIGLVIYSNTIMSLWGIFRFSVKYQISFDGVLPLSKYWDYTLFKIFFMSLEMNNIVELNEIEKSLDSYVESLTKKLLKPQMIAFIAAGDSTFLDALMFIAAKKQGIPNYVFQHGYPDEPYTGFLPILTDNLLVWNEALKRRFDELNEEGSNIVVFGYPKFDRRYIDDANYNLQGDYQKIKSRTILFASQPIEELTQENVGLDIRNKVNEVLIEMKNMDYNIIIRPHPQEIHSIKDHTPKQLHNSIHGGTYDMDSLLHDIMRSDIVVSFNSTTLFESILLGVPALSIYESKKFQITLDCPEIFSVHFSELNVETIKELLDKSSIIRAGDSHYLIDDFSKQLQSIVFEPKTA